MTEADSQEDSLDIELRSPNTVARRFVILAAVMQRFGVDTTTQDDPYGAAFDLREWLRTERMWDDATPGEQSFFTRLPGSPDLEETLDVALVAESLATLAWALGLLQTLSNDHLEMLASVIQETPSPWETTASWIGRQSLRPESEIARMREAQEVWNWRLEVELDRRSSKGLERADIESLIETVTQDAIAADFLPPYKDGGFTIDGVAVTKMDTSKVAEQQLLTQERLIALNWICGFGDDWDDVPVEV